jgi:cytoskeletal protein CcmA (bactofilin family)
MEFIMFDKHKGNKQSVDSGNQLAGSQPVVGNSPSAGSVAGKAAVIGAGIVINGDITGTENLVIEGKVKGSIHLAGHEVSIGNSGEIQANVAAKSIRVAGVVKGDLLAKERVVISKSGAVQGNVTAPRVALEDGAVFKGMIDVIPAEAAKPEPARAKPEVAAPDAKPGAGSAVKTGSSPGLSADPAKKSPNLALKSG